MMSNLRTKHSPTFKAKVAMDALREDRTSVELASQYQVHPGLIRTWKNILMKGAPELFNGKGHTRDMKQAQFIEHLYKKIGQLEVELDWLKKKSGFTP